MEVIDVLIIGAGPIGLSCGIEAKKLGISYKIIDKGCLVNSINNFPEGMTFFSSSNKLEIGGIPFTSVASRPSKQEALEYYRRIAQYFELELGLFEKFESIEKMTDTNQYKIKTSKKTYLSNSIVNATGFYDSAVPLNISGEELDKVNHYFTSAHHLFGQKVAVIGASNSAVDVALEAQRKGADVSLFIRGKSISNHVKYWIKPELENRIKEGAITVYYESNVTEITKSHLRFQHENKQIEIENDFVFAMTGYYPNFKLSELLGIKINKETGYPNYKEESMETNIPGMYLAGVVCGGVNTREWFIENSRDHGEKIMNHIKDKHGFKK